MAVKKKSFNSEVDDIFRDIDLPTDEEARLETGKLKRAEGLKKPSVREKIGKSIKSSQKYKEAMKTRDQSFRETEKYKKEHKERMQALRTDPKFVEAQKKGRDALRNDPDRMAEYEKNNRAAYLKAKEDPAYWEAYYAAIKVRDADPEYHKKRIDASKKKICRKVQTPLGIFNSITEAATAHGMGNTETMRNRLKSRNFPDYILLDDKK